MVVQTRGDEPSKDDKSWEEKYAPWLLAAGLGGIAVGGGVVFGHSLTPRIPSTRELIWEAPKETVDVGAMRYKPPIIPFVE